MKNAILSHVRSYDSCKIRCFGRTCGFHHQGDKNTYLRSVFLLRVTTKILLSSPIFVDLIMEEISSSETSVLTRATRRVVLEDVYFKYKIVHRNVIDVLSFETYRIMKGARRSIVVKALLETGRSRVRDPMR
jgi:hypothetical protein